VKSAKRLVLITLGGAGVIASFWLTWPAAGWFRTSILTLLAEFVPPAVDPAFLQQTGVAAVQTLAISIAGTALAFLFSFSLAWLSTARRTLAWLSRGLFVLLRAVPDLLWALIFVFVAGLGPAAGALALAFHTTGVLGKLFGDTFENVDRRIVESVASAGGSPSAVSLYAVVPQAWAQCISFALYRWETNIRSATIVGVVGAGGLGQMIYTTTNLFQYRRVATLILAIFAIVVIVDHTSRRLQRIYS
jgi:phosphonate transport system permease protein